MDSITQCVVRGKFFFFFNGDSVTNIENKFRLHFNIQCRGGILIRNTILFLRTLDSFNNFVVVKLDVYVIYKCI